MTIERLRAIGFHFSAQPMPGRIRGHSEPIGSGYHVMINSNLCDDAMWRALLHEVKHIVENHFDNVAPVEIIERYCQTGIDPAESITEDEYDQIDPAG